MKTIIALHLILSTPLIQTDYYFFENKVLRVATIIGATTSPSEGLNFPEIPDVLYEFQDTAAYLHTFINSQ